MTIEEFIRARLDEDEQIARESDSGDGKWGFDERFDHVGTSDETIHSLHHSEHIARHDPARVLRQVAAVRKILARHDEAERESVLSERDAGYEAGLSTALDLIASIWSDHPDYRPEWSPEAQQ